MIEAWSLAGSAALVGFLGSVHCIGMCGGIAGALAQAAARGGRGLRLLTLSCYSLGRITSYAVAGALVSAAGFILAGPLGWRGPLVLRTLAGIILVALGLTVSGWWPLLRHLEALGLGLWRRVSPLAARIQPVASPPRAFLLGLLWGWLPCGLVYSALLSAAAAGSAPGGALVMTSFGLGTLPALLAAGALAQQLAGLARRRGIRGGAGLLILSFGVWTIVAACLPLLMGMPHEAGTHAH
jgi:sulfite exporter TauE/SafE